MMTHQCVTPPHGSGVPYKQMEFLQIVPYIHSRPSADPILDHQDRAPLAGTSLWSARSAASQPASRQALQHIARAPSVRSRRPNKNKQKEKRQCTRSAPAPAAHGQSATRAQPTRQEKRDKTKRNRKQCQTKGTNATYKTKPRKSLCSLTPLRGPPGQRYYMLAPFSRFAAIFRWSRPLRASAAAHSHGIRPFAVPAVASELS